MFTGIIQEIGAVQALQRADGLLRLTIYAPKTASLVRPGESVSINGVCVSPVRVRQGALTVEVIPETRRLTNLGALAKGAPVNVEPSLTLSDRLSGHLVLGHVDGVGRIVQRKRQTGQITLRIRLDRTLRRSIVPKAPIAIDGVSLTIGERLSPTTFSVFLIPETLQKTVLGGRRVGELVNIEIDYFAKLIAQWRARS